MKRLLWIGVGAGAAYYAARWWRRQKTRYSAEHIGAKVGETVKDVAELLRVSVEEGRRAAAEREAEIRETLGEPLEERRGAPKPLQ